MTDDHTLIRDYLLRMTTRGDLVAALDRLVRERDEAREAILACIGDAEGQEAVEQRTPLALTKGQVQLLAAALAVPAASEGEAG